MDYNNLIAQFNPKKHKMKANQIHLLQHPPAYLLKASCFQEQFSPGVSVEVGHSDELGTPCAPHWSLGSDPVQPETGAQQPTPDIDPERQCLENFPCRDIVLERSGTSRNKQQQTMISLGPEFRTLCQRFI